MESQSSLLPTVFRVIDVSTHLRRSGAVSDTLRARAIAEGPNPDEVAMETARTHLLAAVVTVKYELVIARERLENGFISSRELKARVMSGEKIIADTLQIIAQSGKIDAPEVSFLHAYRPAGMLIQDTPSDEKGGFDTIQDTVVLQGICDGLFGTLEAAQRYLRDWHNLPLRSRRLTA